MKSRMNQRLFEAIWSMSVLFLYATVAQAAVVIDKPPNGILSATERAGNSNVGLNWERGADDFILTTSSTSINSVSWYGYFGAIPLTKTTADFDILFYNDVSGVPVATPFYTTTVTNAIGSDTGQNAGLFDILQWTASVPTTTFTGAGTYWISIQAYVDITAFPLAVWQWAGADPIFGESEMVTFQNEGTTDWSVCGITTTCNADLYVAQAFTLASVPLPAAVWLFGSGLLGLVGIARRKKA